MTMTDQKKPPVRSTEGKSQEAVQKAPGFSLVSCNSATEFDAQPGGFYWLRVESDRREWHVGHDVAPGLKRGERCIEVTVRAVDGEAITEETATFGRRSDASFHEWVLPHPPGAGWQLMAANTRVNIHEPVSARRSAYWMRVRTWPVFVMEAGL